MKGGEWSGLYIFHGNTSNNVAVGDLVVLTGLLVEFYNMTELTQVSSYSIISSNNAVPITTLTTSQLPFGAATSEVYEGVMVRFNDVQIKSTIDGYGQFKVADSSGVQAMIDDVFYAQQLSNRGRPMVVPDTGNSGLSLCCRLQSIPPQPR
jgi:predicted extracellular nuclease